MAKRVIGIDWISENLVPFLNKNEVKKSKKLQEALKLVEREQRIKETIATSDMTLEDIFDVFDLKDDDPSVFNLKSDGLVPIPDDLQSMCQRLSKPLGKRHISNEAVARCFINLVLVFVLTKEKTLTERFKKMNVSSSSFTPLTPLTISTPTNAPADIGLHFEVPLAAPIWHEGRNKLCQGSADYTIRYCLETHEKMAKDFIIGNLVVVEAKRQRFVGFAIAQLLAYLGIIHQTRKNDGNKDHSIVYGIVTDGNEYRFYRINDEGKVSSSRSYMGDSGERLQIYSTLRLIMQTAVIMTPTTSPIKGSILKSEDRFDYDVGKTLGEALEASKAAAGPGYWDDDPSVEVVNPEAEWHIDN